MDRTWYVIDGDGRRRIGRGSMNFWEKFDYSGDDSDWPGFTQIVARAELSDLENALFTVAHTLGLRLVDAPIGASGHVLRVCQNGEALVASEPGLEVEERFLQAETAEAILGLLAVDGAFFGHEPSSGLIHATTFELGAPEIAWYDSAQPGPSFARTFHRDGRCTERDPRIFALEKMGMPATSPLLDRYAFVQRMLEPLGIEGIWPELQHLPAVAEYAFEEGS